jgi:hypothetical protein
MPDPLVLLVRQLLFAGSDGLSAPQLAAYIAGWTAALELVERADRLSTTHADPALRVAITQIVGRIREAQRVALGGDDDEDA